MKKFIITRADKAEILPQLATLKSDVGALGDEDMQVSDGYHTMDELYEHRIVLFIALCRLVRERNSEGGNAPDWEIWRSKLHNDGSNYAGWFILGIGKEIGYQMSYHLPLSKWEQTEFAETLERAPKWDGHTPADVLERLNRL